MKTCSKCGESKSEDLFHRSKGSADGLHGHCKECCRKAKKNHYDRNRESLRNKARVYYSLRRGYYNSKSKEYGSSHLAEANARDKSRRGSDPLYKLTHSLRMRIYKLFSNSVVVKSVSTIELLGADWSVVKSHIENQFECGMTWGNHGDWHIDHVIPLASATNEQDLMRLCHYTNLQPLWAEENRKKNSRFSLSDGSEVIARKGKLIKVA